MARQSNLQEYKRKRDFNKTPEPEGKVQSSPEGHLFIIQKHAATRLHYDFRIEMNGTLKSWAVPKGPSLDPADKRLAVHVEDHPIEYGSFEGLIPKGEYGGGTVMLWDRGWWEPIGDAEKGYEKGHFKFRLHGEKLQGAWALVQLHGERSEEGKNWLLVKEKDETARPASEYDITAELTASVKTSRSMEEIAKAQDKVWTDAGEVKGKEAEEKLKNQKQPKITRKRAAKAEKKSEETKPAINPAALHGARKGTQPEFIQPELATLVKEVPEGANWLHEVKFDGYRLLAIVKSGTVRLVTRNNNDWTARFAPIARAVEGMGIDEAIFDGEIVVLNEKGISDFQKLQNNVKSGAKHPLHYFIFDMPWFGGYDLTACTLVERKALLRQVLQSAPDSIRISEHIEGGGDIVFENATKLNLEGIVSKRMDSTYEQRRSKAWLKIKCNQRQEFIIVGYTDPSGSRTHFGALLLGYYDEHMRLIYCGRVGTGFSDQTLTQVHKRLKPLEEKQPPVVNAPRGAEARGVHWLRPEVLCEVTFSEWTGDGQLRHPSFQGLREDKVPEQVQLEVQQITPSDEEVTEKIEQASTAQAQDIPMGNEREEPPPRKSTPRKRGKKEDDPVVGGVRISNPDRIIYPGQGVTKLALAQYYDAVADLILPYIIKRPISVVRCPQGVGEKCFYQRHVGETLPEPIRGVPIMTSEGEKSYIVIDDKKGLMSLIQFGVLEIHPWGCLEDDVEHPDYIVFDLDPAPDVAWDRMVAAALDLRRRLREAGLESYVKTSGGKGLHIVVPFERGPSWDEAKEFSRVIASAMVHDHPNDFIATMSKARRTGKIFIDFFRNSRTATSVAPYSTRARAGAPVSLPISWEDLKKGIAPDQFNIENAAQRLAKQKKDPWKDFFAHDQSLPEK